MTILTNSEIQRLAERRASRENTEKIVHSVVLTIISTFSGAWLLMLGLGIFNYNLGYWSAFVAFGIVQTLKNILVNTTQAGIKSARQRKQERIDYYVNKLTRERQLQSWHK